MKISQEELKDILVEKASKIVSKQEAEYYAQESIETHLRKIPRNNPIKSSITDLLKSLEQDTSIQMENDLWASLRINFNSHWPLIYSKMVHDLVEQRTLKYWIVMISLVNGQWIHTLQHWVQGLAKRWIVSIISANWGPAWVIPYNWTKWVFWTNPLAYWFPNKNGDQCIDMATSEAPYFEIMQAHAKWENLRDWIAVDNQGDPTTLTSESLDFSQPEAISNLTPIWWGYKGYNIVYFFEILTSWLIWSQSSPEMAWDFVPEEHGAILIAMNPNSLWTSKNLQDSLDAVNWELEKQIPKKWEKIEIPGMRSNLTLKKNKDIEIEIDDVLFEKLKNL